MPILRSVKFDSCQESQKTIVTIEFVTLDLFRVQNFIKIEAFAVLRPKLWPKRWQVPTLTGVKNTENCCHQWIQHLQIIHYAKFCGKWLTSFPVPRSPFPVPLFKDSLFCFSRYLNFCLKVRLSPSKKFCVIFLIESPLKMMKNTFYFILKTLFVPKIFTLLSRLFAHVRITAWSEW